MVTDRELKKISLSIGEDQYQEISQRGLNLSWLIRDLLDQFLHEKKIILDVNEETLQLFQKIVKHTNGIDSDFEIFFRDALHAFLKSKIEKMQKLEKQTFRKEASV
jgi:hypothetical protein